MPYYWLFPPPRAVGATDPGRMDHLFLLFPHQEARWAYSQYVACGEAALLVLDCPRGGYQRCSQSQYSLLLALVVQGHPNPANRYTGASTLFQQTIATNQILPQTSSLAQAKFANGETFIPSNIS